MAQDDELLPEEAPAEDQTGSEAAPDETVVEEEPTLVEETPGEDAPAETQAEEVPSGEEAPAEEGGGEGAESPEEGAAESAVVAALPPVAPEAAKPKSNVWTLLMIVSFVTMMVGIYLQGAELNELYRVKFWILK